MSHLEVIAVMVIAGLLGGTVSFALSRTEGFSLKVEAYGLVGDEAPLIVKSLGNSKYSRRTVGGIQKDTGAPPSKVSETLDWLVANGLAVSSGAEVRYWGPY
jgi:hypothetical protein